MASLEAYRLWANDQLTAHRRLSEAFEADRLISYERLDSGEIVNRTPEAIADCRRVISDLENLLKDEAPDNLIST